MNAGAPIVSVVLPFLDTEAFLADAIASVRAQTWPDWELVLIDDGSSDGSRVIAEAAARDDPRVRVLTRPEGIRGGAAAARNIGIRHAHGEFIAFLDADDLYEPHQLATLVHAFEQHAKVVMVYAPTRWWHPGAEARDWTEHVRGLGGRVHRPPRLFSRVLLLQRGHVPCTCGVMVRRTALGEVGGFEESFELYEDQTLWAKLMLRFPVYVEQRPGARYRQHDGSTTARSERSGAYDRMRAHAARPAFLAWAQQCARAHHVTDASVERAFRIAFAPYEDHRVPLTWRDRGLVAALHTDRLARMVVRRLLRLVGRLLRPPDPHERCRLLQDLMGKRSTGGSHDIGR